MAKPWQFDADAVDLEAAVTLVVVRRQGKRLMGHRIEVETDVDQALRDLCWRTLDRIRALDPRRFGPDVRVDPGSEYLTVPGIPLVQPTAEPVRAAGDDDDNDDEEDGVAADVALPDILGRASSLERLSAQGLPAGFLLYAAVVGDNPADRHAFVRK